jgi:TPR repeat protein
LARRRFEAKRWEMTRLTLIDAVGKGEPRARLTNLLAVVESGWRDPRDTQALYEQAAKEGSTAALLNLAVFHFRGSRVQAAKVALGRFLEATGENGEAAKDPNSVPILSAELRAQIKEFLQP